MLHILTVVGARPNFVKAGALHRAFVAQPGLTSRILHTGQHYDAKMSDVFFDQLELPRPDVYLGLGGGTHAEQTGRIMMAFEREVERNRPDLLVVVGDVNSTLACALVAVKLGIPVAHVEAGLRSGDRGMPEEINRVLTDAISDYLFVTEQSGLDHLFREGIDEEKVYYVGNVMIDSLQRFRDQAEATGMCDRLGVEKGRYALMTMHRPATVESPERLAEVAELIERVEALCPVIFPVHPRTRKRMAELGLLPRLDAIDGLMLMEPVGYLEFLHLTAHAGVVITDSGGVQEETTYLQVPCLTVRPSTERPVTVDVGTNVLVPLDPPHIAGLAAQALAGSWKAGAVPHLWDGRAAERIASVLAARYTSYGEAAWREAVLR